jgi:hypothetical protein
MRKVGNLAAWRIPQSSHVARSPGSVTLGREQGELDADFNYSWHPRGNFLFTLRNPFKNYTAGREIGETKCALQDFRLMMRCNAVEEKPSCRVREAPTAQ